MPGLFAIVCFIKIFDLDPRIYTKTGGFEQDKKGLLSFLAATTPWQIHLIHYGQVTIIKINAFKIDIPFNYDRAFANPSLCSTC
jgi:hypothetical protein